MSTGSITVLVTVHSPQGAADLELPADVPVRELLPLVVAVCGSRARPGQPGASLQWALGRAAGPPFSAERTLVDHEVMDGAVLRLGEAAAWGRAAMEAHPPLPDDADSLASEVALGGIGIRWNRTGLTS
jgi:hypothetical protein